MDFVIRYTTSNSNRRVGIVNGAESPEQALISWVAANGFKAKGEPFFPNSYSPYHKYLSLDIRGRVGSFYAIHTANHEVGLDLDLTDMPASSSPLPMPVLTIAPEQPEPEPEPEPTPAPKARPALRDTHMLDFITEAAQIKLRGEPGEDKGSLTIRSAQGKSFAVEVRWDADEVFVYVRGIEVAYCDARREDRGF